LIKQILFPIKTSIIRNNEYDHHYKFIYKYAKLNNINITTVSQSNNNKVFCNKLFFSILIDNEQTIIDYSDHTKLSGNKYVTKVPYFKFHYSEKIHENHKGVYPIGPMLDIIDYNNYNYFFNYIKQNNYFPEKNDMILNLQRPRYRAFVRRSEVQHMLKRKYRNMVKTVLDFKEDDQKYFWHQHKCCLLAVSVPGARNNMLDRGHLEEFLMGVAVISPKIITMLPNNTKLIPNVHYIECKNNYSNLINIIEYYKKNKKKLKEIGNNAKKILWNCYNPKNYWKWIEKCINNFKEK